MSGETTVVLPAPMIICLTIEPDADAFGLDHLEDLVVQAELVGPEAHRDDELAPGGQVAREDLAAAPLHELVELLGERPHATVHLAALLPLVALVAAVRGALVDVLLVELLEASDVAEEAGLDAVDHVEVLDEVVLHRGAREQHAPA